MRIIEDAYEAQQGNCDSFYSTYPYCFSLLASVVSSLIPSYAKKLIVKGLSNPFSMEPLYQFGVELLLRDKVHQKGEKKVRFGFRFFGIFLIPISHSLGQIGFFDPYEGRRYS